MRDANDSAVISPEAEFLTVDEACRLLKVGRTVGYSLARADQWPVPVVKIGKQYRISRRALTALIERQHGDERARS